MDKKELYDLCHKCGRPWPKASPKPCPCVCGIGSGEYGKKVAGCIRNKNPECPYNAVIPSVTVDDISGLKTLRDAFVHVSNINTTFYVDDKGRMMITWAGPVEIPEYDYQENPLNLRGQMLFTTEGSAKVVVYYDKTGNYQIIATSDLEVDNALSLTSENPVQNKVITEALERKQDKLTAGTNITIEPDAVTGDLIISALGGSGSAQLEADLTASVTVGGIRSGTTYTAGTPFETLWRDLLNPVAVPTLTAPTATLTGSGDKLLEVGSTYEATMTINYNRGRINPAYGTNGFRAGEAISYQLNVGTPQAGNTFTVTVTGDNNMFSGSVEHSAGEQPKDSVGNNYDSPYPAGTISTNSVTYEFVNALYGTTVSIDEMTKQPLVSKSAKEYVFNLVAQTDGNPAMFDVPASWTVTAVQGYNDLTSRWEDIEDFVVSDTTHNDAAGNSVAYKRYTDDRGYAADGRQIKVKWS